MAIQLLPSSFRDPAGYIVRDSGQVKRVITPAGLANFSAYLASGLHQELTAASLIVDHHEEPQSQDWPRRCAKLIVPQQLEFISYPYEWSFEQLKDAALLTLEVQRRSLQRGMSLKDASAYNVQFDGCRAVFIDTLSFEPDPGGPWIAYEQFCRHFLGPLLLMQHGGSDVRALLRGSLDGIPVPVAAAALPMKSLLRTGPLIHLHLHARFLAKTSAEIGGDRSKQQPLPSRLAFLQSLQKAVEKIQAPPAGRQSEWIGYRETRTHYSAAALASKAELVEAILRRLRPRLVYDLGANTGEYSALAARLGSRCVAFDGDAACVGSMYRREKERAGWLLPLVMDLANPSPALGFANEERMSLTERGHADLTLVLGLVHHLRITANIPFQLLGRFLARISSDLLIEFVPPEDPMAERMLHGRPPFEDYSLEGFVEAVSPWFELASSMPVRDSFRTLLHFERAL